MIDSACIKAHRSASGVKRGEQAQAIGRSRGGRNTKIHAITDAKGRLLAFLLTGGQARAVACTFPNCIGESRRQTSGSTVSLTPSNAAWSIRTIQCSGTASPASRRSGIKLRPMPTT